MKKLIPCSLLAALFITTPLLAGDMGGMKMNDSPKAATAVAGATKTVGVVKAIDLVNGKISIAHEPIPTLNWPAMKMNFIITPALGGEIKAGQKVEFEFVMQGRDAIITKIVAVQ